MTALRAQSAVAFDRTIGKVAVNGANLGDEGIGRGSAGWHGQ